MKSRTKIVSVAMLLVAGTALFWSGTGDAQLDDPEVFADPRVPLSIPDEIVEAAIDAALSTPTSEPEKLPQPPLLAKRSSAVGAKLAEVAPNVFFGFTLNSKGEQLVRSGAVAARRLGDGRLVDLVMPERYPWVMTFNGTDVYVFGDDGFWKAPLDGVQAGTPSWVRLDSFGKIGNVLQPGVPSGTTRFSFVPTDVRRIVSCWKLTCAWAHQQNWFPGPEEHSYLGGAYVSFNDRGSVWGFGEFDTYRLRGRVASYAGDGIASLSGVASAVAGDEEWTLSERIGEGLNEMDPVHWSAKRRMFVGAYNAPDDDNDDGGDGLSKRVVAFAKDLDGRLDLPMPVPPSGGELLDYLELEDGTPMYLYRTSPGSYVVRRGSQEVVAVASLDFSPTFGPYSGGGFVTVSSDFSQSYTLASSHDDGRTWNTTPTLEVDVIANVNAVPVCTGAVVSPVRLWPPNHQLVDITISGVTDPDGDTVAIAPSGVTQDEPMNGLGDGDSSPDAVLGATGVPLKLRSERSGKGDGRVYTINFVAKDPAGASCSGKVKVSVPKNANSTAVDSGGTFNSIG